MSFIFNLKMCRHLQHLNLHLPAAVASWAQHVSCFEEAGPENDCINEATEAGEDIDIMMHAS